MARSHEPTSNRMLLRGFVVLAVAILAVIGLVTLMFVQVQALERANQTAEIRLAASEKHQAQQRVITVKARCDLTRLDLSGRRGASRVLFEASLEGCLGQLKTVERLAGPSAG